MNNETNELKSSDGKNRMHQLVLVLYCDADRWCLLSAFNCVVYTKIIAHCMLFEYLNILCSVFIICCVILGLKYLVSFTKKLMDIRYFN